MKIEYIGFLLVSESVGEKKTTALMCRHDDIKNMTLKDQTP